MANKRYLHINPKKKKDIYVQQILLGKEQGTQGTTTPTIQKLQKFLKLD